MRLATFIVLLAVLGCSPQKRAAKHITKAEKLCPECFTDDTIIIQIPGREISTQISLQPGETRTIERDGISLSVKAVNPLDSLPPIYIDCICDTIYKEIITPVITPPKLIPREKNFFEQAQDFLFWVFMALLALILLPKILDLIYNKK